METTTTRKQKLGEPDAHVMMRHARSALRLLLIVALTATIALLIFYRKGAYLAALPVLPLFLGFIFVSYLEKQSRAGKIRVKNQTKISSKEIELDVQYAGIYTAVALLLLFAFATFLIAATMIDGWAMVGLTTAVLFLLAVFIVFPYIPLFIEGAEQDERDKLELESLKAEGGDQDVRHQYGSFDRKHPENA